MIRIYCFALFFIVTSAASAAAEQLETVEALLLKASMAVQEKNYRGRYTYEAGGALETLEVAHGVVDGVEKERVFHLNGEQRSFLRQGRRSNCISTGSFLQRGGLISVAGNTVSLAQNYHFYLRGGERIAGRDASVIQVAPKDEHRYGVMLALDNASHLPLMSLTMSKKSILERYQAVSIDVGEFDFDSVFSGRDSQSVVDGSNLPCAKPKVDNVSWRPRWLPAGFVVSHQGVDEEMGQSLTYTDGIASFTLFVKPVQDASSVKQGAARRGATTAYLGLKGSPSRAVQVALIGEIPIKTARQIVANIGGTVR